MANILVIGDVLPLTVIMGPVVLNGSQNNFRFYYINLLTLPKTHSREFVHVLENNLARDSLHTQIYIEDVSGGGPSCYSLAHKDCSICTMSGRKGR